MTDLMAGVAMIFLLVAIQASGRSGAHSVSESLVCQGNLKQMIFAWQTYAEDYGGWFPPNEDNGQVTNWVSGTMTLPEDATNTWKLTGGGAAMGEYFEDPRIFKCPADHSAVRIEDHSHERMRSYSMNQAVGTLATVPITIPPTVYEGPIPVDGPWLDNHHSHKRNHPYRTFGSVDDVGFHGASRLWVILDEHPLSINDPSFAIGMNRGERTEFIEWPAVYHGLGCNLAYADGHVGYRRWEDVDTQRILVGFAGPARVISPNNADLEWLIDRTSHRVE